MSETTEWRPKRDGPWAAVDAGLLRHRKLERLPRASTRLLYVALVLHCADELSDGHIASFALPRLLLSACAKPADLDELEAAGLVDRDPEDGYHVHDYLDWNPPRTWWDKQRERNAAKAAAFRLRQRENRQNPSIHPERNRSRTGHDTGNATGHDTGRRPGTTPVRQPGTTPVRHGPNETFRVINPPNPPSRDPSARCAECGEKLGHGHLEDCPRMPRTGGADSQPLRLVDGPDAA